ncbi:MAG: TonB-dependent receptor [Xanthomonadaceae bacterium]|nr:TonB-dependent receptor [Xanthomonadaceae bacterium]MDP2186649.1 TonB-dependent receptor [Xanthomonadales bacterium]MDZ4114523.1 TonB-dependent receptor [Xanthomonadaceae bacterium]MDZ4378963.1 TonB-dependent receptor [Xanthomonadaceae bacterium]
MQSNNNTKLQPRLLTLLISALLSPAAMAQQANEASAEDAKRLDDVVVTAQKRSQALEDVPIAITVIDRETLEKERGRTLFDLQQLAPNFQLVKAGFNSITIRGVGGGGRSIGFDTRAGMYLDGVYLGQSPALNMPLFDIEQVEILRGPQGHLFGRNTVSGAVNVTTAAPSPFFDAKLRAVYGNNDAFEGYGSVTGPISESVLGKIAASYETRDGYTRNVFNGDDLDNLDRFSTRGELSFLVSDKLTIDVYGDYSDTEENTIIGEPITAFFDSPLPGGVLPDRNVNFNTTPFINAELYGGSVKVTYDMNSGDTLTAISGYRNTKQQRQNDTDYSAADIIRINFNDKFEQFSQELRIASSNEGRLRYVLGVFYLNEQADSDRRVTIGQDMNSIVALPAGSPIPFAPVGLAFRVTAGSVVPAIANIETENVAGFGSLDFDITSRLTLNLGARYTHETKDIVFNLDGSRSGAFRIGSLDNFRDGRTDNKFTPTAGFTFALNDDVNVYAKYARGFKSGGWNTDFLNVGQIATGFDFETETVDSYEAGLKGLVLDRRLRFDLAAFYNEFSDFQQFQFVSLGGGTTVLQLRNAAKVESQGVEGSISLQVNENLRLGANAGYVDATFDKFPNGGPSGQDLSGNELPSPDTTAALTIDYGVPVAALGGRIDFFGEYSYRSNYFSGATNDPLYERIGSRNLVNARLGFSNDAGDFGVSLWGRNVFKEKFIDNRGRDFFGNQFVTRGEPRSYGIELWHNF